MKRKLLLSFALAFTITSTSFAAEIYKGKIIHLKDWTSGNNIKATLADVTKPRLKTNSEDESEYHLYSNIDFAEGVAGMPVNINGEQAILIHNATDITKTYNIGMNVCAMTSDKTERCSYHNEQIELAPDGYFNTQKASSLQLTFDKADTYSAYVEIFVTDDQDRELKKWAMAASMNKILIASSNKS